MFITNDFHPKGKLYNGPHKLKSPRALNTNLIVSGLNPIKIFPAKASSFYSNTALGL